jgi:hypothetical protein
MSGYENIEVNDGAVFPISGTRKQAMPASDEEYGNGPISGVEP